MSQSDSRQRYANKNANQSRPSRPNWGSEARDFRPVGQRYGSVLVLSGPKRKQAGPSAVRKPIPRPVNLPSQRKDRHAEGSLLGSKQGRPEDSSQQVESTTHSLNSQSWQNSSTGTWSAPQEATSRTDEYGFPIRSEAPINAREFPTLAASKQSGPPSKQRPQHEQADAYFSLDDRDTLPSELKTAEDRGTASQREDHRSGAREDWRASSGRPGLAPGGSDARDGRAFRDDVDSRLFSNNRPQADSRRGAFGFHTQDQDRSRAGGRPGARNSDSGGGGRDGRSGSRIEEYGLLAGDHGYRSGSKHQEDYLGPAAQMHGAVDVFSSTLLAAGVAPTVATGGVGGAAMKTGADSSDSEEDEELAAHYKELELIKAEEDEKDRQRVLAAEAAGQEGSGAGSGEEEGDGGGDTWEDDVEGDAEATEGAEGDDALGLKPVDPDRWQQRQAEIEAEDRLRRERAEAKKQALEEAIAKREEDKTRAAREASDAALAALAAANQPLPTNEVQVVVPPPPPPPRTSAPSAAGAPGQLPVQPPPPPPPAAAIDEEPAASVAGPRSSDQSASTLATLPGIGDAGGVAGVQQQQQQRRTDFVPAPAPAKPAWGQALYARSDSSQKLPVEPTTGSAATAAAAAQMMQGPADARRQDVSSQQSWNSHVSMEHASYWRDENNPAPHRPRGAPHGPTDGGLRGCRDAGTLREDGAGHGRDRGRRTRGEGRSGGRGRHALSDIHNPHSSTPSAADSSTPQIGNIHSTASSVTAAGAGTPPPAAPSVSASSNANSDADAAAVAAAAKAAKAMENIALPTLPSPVYRKCPVDILPASGGAPTALSAAHHAAGASRPNPTQDVQTSKAPAGSTLQREGSVAVPPQPQHSAPAVYESPYANASDLGLPSSNSVPALDTDEKHAGMFDGADMGENLLPSNILGLDDAPYPTSKPHRSDSVSSANHQLLPMHDPSFSPSLDQKALSPIARARPFTRSDHGAPLGAPLTSTPSYPGPQAPQSTHGVRERLPDQAQFWGLPPGHEWEAHAQQQQPPLHPPSKNLHLHAGGFGSVPVPSPGAYNSPAKAPQHSAAPGTAPVSSAPPVFHNNFGYPSGTVFGAPSFTPNTQLHLPLVPTSKPPDWSNHGPTTLGWNAMHPHGVPPPRPMNVLGPPGSMPQSQDAGGFQMQDPQAAHGGYSASGVPMNGMPVGHQHNPQHRMRLSDVEMQLPDNLGLGTSQPITHLSLAPPPNSQHMPPQGNMHVRSGGGGGGVHRSNTRGGRGGGGGASNHNSGGHHGLGAHHANTQSGSRGGADGHATNSSSNNTSSGGRGDRRHGGHGGSDHERNAQGGGGGGRRHGGRSGRGGHGRSHGRRGRGGHPADTTGTPASLVSVE